MEGVKLQLALLQAKLQALEAENRILKAKISQIDVLKTKVTALQDSE